MTEQAMKDTLRLAFSDAEAVKALRGPRWARCRDQTFGDYEQSPTESTGPATGGFNVQQVKKDAYVAGVASALCSQPTVVKVSGYDGEDLEERTDAVNRMLQVARLERKLPMVLADAWWSNFGCWLVQWSRFPVSQPQLTCVDVFDMVAWPTFRESLQDCDVVLRAVTQTQAEVDALVKAGVYKPSGGQVLSGAPVSHQVNKPASTPATEVGSSGLVTLYHGFVRDPATKALTEVTCSLGGDVVYRSAPYVGSIVPFVVWRLKPNRGTDGVFPSCSKAHDLQGVQIALAASLATHEAGAAEAANSPVFTDDDKLHKALSGRRKPGASYLGASLAHVIQVTSDFDPDGSVAWQQVLWQLADQVAGSPQMSSGGSQQGVDTATEANILATGAQTMMDAAVLSASDGLETLAAVVDELMRTAPDKAWFHEHYSADEGFQEAYVQEAAIPASFSAAVTSTAGTPQSQMQMLLGTAAQVLQLGGAVDVAALTEKAFALLQRSGVANASELAQDPGGDVQAAVQTLAGATGVPEEYVVQALRMVRDHLGGGAAPGGYGDQPGGMEGE